jgi:hypothetical protein
LPGFLEGIVFLKALKTVHGLGDDVSCRYYFIHNDVLYHTLP